jgi:hypothetical protein
VNRKFLGEGDVESGEALAEEGGVELTKHLALRHLHKAMKCLPLSEFSRVVLGSLGHRIYARIK